MRNSNRDNNSFFATAVKWSIHQPWVLKKADIVKKKKERKKLNHYYLRFSLPWGFSFSVTQNLRTQPRTKRPVLKERGDSDPPEMAVSFTVSQCRQVPVAVVMAFLGQSLGDSGRDDLGLSEGLSYLYDTFIFISGGASSVSHSVPEPPGPDLEVYN